MYAIIQLYLEKLLFFLKTLFYFCDQILENMLQRIQTVYLLIAAIVSLGLIFVFAFVLIFEFDNSELLALSTFNGGICCCLVAEICCEKTARVRLRKAGR